MNCQHYIKNKEISNLNKFLILIEQIIRLGGVPICKITYPIVEQQTSIKGGTSTIGRTEKEIEYKLTT